ncbi:MAG: non-ribosomal peptide synthetase, partial [Marivirga sp.]|nr:non-ribosomal peptide synthetase [Marivirga sp.]
FDVMLVFQNFDQEELIIPGLRLKPYECEHNISKLDLTLTAIESNDTLHLNFEYSTELFTAQTIDRFIFYFQRIISAVTSNADIKLSQIEILSETERHELLHVFNDTGVSYPSDKTLVDLFEDQVRKHPDQVAVFFNGECLSYKELDERSSQLARYLVWFGIVPGSVVGLLLDRSLEMMVSMIGVLKSGGGYLPIDPSLPEQRIAYMLDQSQSSLLLTHQVHLERHSAYLPVRDIDSADLYLNGEDHVKVSIDSGDLAYCIFTSGSTGMPKGVMMPHKSVVNLVKGLETRVYNYHGNKPLRVALLASYSFDASVQQIFGSLLQGHSLYICDEHDRKDGNRLIDFYNENEIDLSDGTPTHLRLLLNCQGEGNALKSLRSWILAGESLPKDLVKEFYKNQANRHVKLYNFYGPTETCVDSTGFEISVEKLANYQGIPIGTPLPNERVYITDRFGNLVPVGVTGELCIGGDGLAQRYIGDASLTSEKFREDWVKCEKRVYRTGDLARWLVDGNIEYQGRMDHQVKIRGYRIELAEIERQLLSHAGVKNAVVQVKEVKDEKHLVGYYVSEERLGVSSLRDHMSVLLPEYMIPSYFVHLESIPLTVNGKLDHKSLPAVSLEIDQGYKGPSNAVEEKLVSIWSEILKLDKDIINVESSFFELGGNSLRLVFLANKLKQIFQTEFSLARLIELQNIVNLGSAIQKAKTSEYKSIERVSSKAYYRLSSAQDRLYFLHEFDKFSLAYNMPQAVKLD